MELQTITSRRALALVFGATAMTSAGAAAFLAETVPTEIQMPGTQPLEVPALTPPDHCANCHGGYDLDVEPAHNWRGSMMAHASRDPLFWATVAVSEQDFDGSGDLCLRCHVADGWLDGRSTPTDGSALDDSDANGVSCHLCHKLTNPDDSEHLGEQNAPFVANDGGSPVEGYYGSSMMSVLYDDIRLGPYANATAANHQFARSLFHRESEMCGTCHDVSNPATGDLAHDNGAQVPLAPGTFSGELGSPVEEKAAFHNPPYRYGVVERTFSEHAASAFPALAMADYPSLPPDLRQGSIQDAYDAAISSTPSGNYADGAVRYFTCQSCHMRPVTGKGCNKPQAPVRADLPSHDLTGGNYWMPDVLAHMDGLGQLPLGGGLSADELSGLQDGKARALHNLTRAAALEIDGDLLRITNLTGHKLLSGYPEGRRMWVRIHWRDAADGVLRVDGEYGPIQVTVGGAPAQVDSLVDVHDPNTKVYEAHHGLTQEWATQLLALGYPPTLPVAYDRLDGSVTATLGDVAAQAPGTGRESFHFVLNNTVLADDRIPPYGMRYDDAVERNILPVPPDQYGAPASGGTYEHWDAWDLNPPPGAASADVELLYQPTSWEYVLFLYLANDGTSPFLGSIGVDLLDAWVATGMAAPAVMATTTWTAPFVDCNENGVDDTLDIANGTSQDCNGNGIPDECDIASGSSADADGDGIPDECPTTFCAAKRTSLGCTPSIGSTGLPTLSGPDDFHVTAQDVPGATNGLLLLGFERSPSAGPAGGPYRRVGGSPLGGRGCVLSPQVLATVPSGGTPGICDGAFDHALTQVDMASLGLMAGQRIYAQFWFADPTHPDGTGVGHSDALAITVQP